MKANKKILIPIVGTIFFAIMIIFHSCIKDSFDFDKLSPNVQYNPNFAVPIAYASLDLWDFLQDYDYEELIISDPVTGFLSIVYSKRVFSVFADDIINISDQNYFETFTKADVDATGFNPNHMIKENIDGFAVLASELLDSMVFKSANLNIWGSSSFLHEGTLVITFPEMKKNGGPPYSQTIDINTSDGTFIFNNTYTDLSGYLLDLSNLGTDTNKVFIKYDLTLDDSGSPVNLLDNVSINVSFTDIEFSTLYGYVGQPSLDFSLNKIHLEMYDNALTGYVYFKNPKLNIYMQNSYGIPIQFWLDSLAGIDTVGSWYDITGTGEPFAFPKLVKYPDLSQIGQTIKDSFVVDTTSCNIRDIIYEYLPQYISFKVNAEVNPDGYTDQNFVTDSSQFDLDLEIELPCWGYASYFLLQDTAEFDFVDEVYTGASEDDSLLVEDLKEDFQWALFRINIDNWFPVEADVQVILTDSLYQPVYYLYTSGPEQLVAAGRDTNGDKKVDTPTHKVTDVMYTKENIDALMEIKNILFWGEVSTTDHSNIDVKFYESYKIDIHVGLQIEYDINTSDYNN